MAILVAAVVILGVLVLLNLLFCFGMLRRLREHTEILDTRLGAATAERAAMLGPGQPVGTFEVTSTDGTTVSRDVFTGTTLLGVFTMGCDPCKERLPLFIEHAARHTGGPVLALVVGTAEDTAPYVTRLEAVATVIREDDSGPVAAALEVQGFPAFATIGTDGVVIASGITLGALAVPASV